LLNIKCGKILLITIAVV